MCNAEATASATRWLWGVCSVDRDRKCNVGASQRGSVSNVDRYSECNSTGCPACVNSTVGVWLKRENSNAG